MISDTSIFIGVGTSAAAALLLSTGTIVQALDAREVEHHHGLRISMLGRLLARKRWVLGTIVGYLAFPFQLIALAHAPLVIVQPVHACGLLLLMAAGARLFSERVHLPDLVGVVAIVIGLVFITWGAPTGRDPPVSEAALAGTSGALLALALIPYFFRERIGKRALILSAAIGFAGTNMAVKGISHDIAVHNWAVLVAYLAAAAIGSTVGVLSQMTAFQRHRAVEVVPLTFSIPTFLPAVLGLVVLRENWATAAAGGLAFGVGGVLLVIGTLAVSRSGPVTSVSEHAVHHEEPARGRPAASGGGEGAAAAGGAAGGDAAGGDAAGGDAAGGDAVGGDDPANAAAGRREGAVGRNGHHAGATSAGERGSVRRHG